MAGFRDNRRGDRFILWIFFSDHLYPVCSWEWFWRSWRWA